MCRARALGRVYAGERLLTAPVLFFVGREIYGPWTSGGEKVAMVRGWNGWVDGGDTRAAGSGSGSSGGDDGSVVTVMETMKMLGLMVVVAVGDCGDNLSL